MCKPDAHSVLASGNGASKPNLLTSKVGCCCGLVLHGGSLIDYSFSKGHLTYLGGTMALHNTLLLHSNTDSMDFFFEGGHGTRKIRFKIEHPWLEGSPVLDYPLDRREGAEAGSVLARNLELLLPGGPMYSRIVLEAENSMWASTKYTFHIIRVGEALSLLLAGEVSSHGMGMPVKFQEKRRWLYQNQHPEWYVPALAEEKDARLEIELRPICFAPLQRATEVTASHSSLVQLAKQCLCGNETAGFGTECLEEQQVLPLHGASYMSCLFLRKTSDELQIDPDKGSLSTDLGLVQWLQNLNESWKWAKLRFNQLHDYQLNRSLGAETLLSAQGGTGRKISTTFSISLPAWAMLRSTQLEIATALDPTNDARNQAVPFRIVPRAPPFELTTRHGFFLPDYAMENRRSEYMACYMSDLTHVQASSLDARFHVEDQFLEMGTDCLGHPVFQKRLWAVRIEQCDYCSRYQFWGDLYDVAVTLSPERCLKEAIDLGNLTALRILEERWIFNKGKEDRCGVLQMAVRLGRLQLIPDLLKYWDRNCPGCDETPLGVAAAVGNVDAIHMLIKNQEVRVDTMDAHGRSALFRAMQGCNLPAVKELIESNSNVNLFWPRTSCAQTSSFSITGAQPL